MKISIFARFARALFTSVHLAAALILSTTWVQDEKFSISSCHLQTADTNFILGQLENILKA